ncbi:MAG: discoidin domain-containing protein, partial [Planctomycetes bacterium]|nr:discoidin domain-containing protein [Planctomycetota bacterium]
MRSKSLVVLVVAFAVVALCRSADAETRTVSVQVKVDSESPGSEAYRAMDGDPRTSWRTPWEPHRRRHPHEITVDLGQSTEVSGFRYRPTRGGGNGAIKDYEFFVSEDENNFGSPAAKGTFDDADSEKRVTLQEKTSGRYVKLRALSEIHRQGWTSIAELRIDAEGVEFRAALPRPEEAAALAATARLGHRP